MKLTQKTAALIQTSVIATVFFCLISAFFSGCSKPGKKFSENDLLTVQTKAAFSENVPMYIDSFGTLAASEDVNIKPRVSGQIQSIHFTEGQYVKKGQLLFSIDPEIFKANLNNSVSSLKYDQSDLRLKKYLVKSNKQIAVTGAMPKQDFQRMLTDYDKARAQIAVDNARMELDKINLKYCSVISPIDGIVGINKVDIGNIVNTADILCNIKCINPLYVDFTVPEKNIKILMVAVSKGAVKTMVYVKRLNDSEDLKTESYAGKLDFLNNSADSSTGTIQLRAIVTNNTGAFLPGEFANVKIEVGEKKNSVLIPQAAVKYGSGGAYLYIAENGYAKRVNIETGDAVNDYYILKKGAVKSGDLIIVTGLESIIPGSKIKVVNL